jgi:pyruvate ferredoxin oxidoreductase alpha subunit
VRQALAGDRRLRRLVVLERALAPGSGGIVTADLRQVLATTACGSSRAQDPLISTVIAGLGGRPVTRKSLRATLLAAEGGVLPPFSFLDLRSDLAEAELARMRATRRSGPSAENILRHLSVTATGALE